MSSISQLQMSYSAEEDRILLRINTTSRDEFRFWLTRRFSQLIIKALKVHCDADPDISTQSTVDAKQAVQSYKQEAANTQGTFNQSFEQSESYPLGESPMLAHKLVYKVEGEKMNMFIEPVNGSGINLNLDSKLNFNIIKLLRTANDNAKWYLDFEEPAQLEPSSRVIN